MKNTITVRLPKRLAKDLNEILKKEDVAISDLLLDSLSQYVAVRRFRGIREQIRPYALKAGIVTDEDAFKAFSRRGD